MEKWANTNSKQPKLVLVHAYMFGTSILYPTTTYFLELEYLQLAGYGVAMQNARDVTKEVFIHTHSFGPIITFG